MQDGIKPVPGNIPAPNSESDLDRSLVRWTRILGIFTIVLALTSVISNIIIYCQLSDAQDSQRWAQEQLRAYIGAPSVVISPGASLDSKPTTAFSVQFPNIGGTRTAYFWAWSSISYYDGEIPNNVDLTKPLNKINSLKTVIGPNSFSPPTTVGISIESMKKAADKKGQILLWGRGGYADIFNPNRERPISFCIVVGVVSVSGQFVLNPVSYKDDCNPVEY